MHYQENGISSDTDSKAPKTAVQEIKHGDPLDGLPGNANPDSPPSTAFTEDLEGIAPSNEPETRYPWWSEDRYTGALLINSLSGSLGPLFVALQNLISPGLDDIPTDAIIAPYLNRGLPRAAFSVIGDAVGQSTIERIELCNTLIAIQFLSGLIASVVMLFVHPNTLGDYGHDVLWQSPRMDALHEVISATEAGLVYSTMALDRPSVALVVEASRFILLLVLNLLFVSKYAVGPDSWDRYTARQVINLISGAATIIIGLLYYLWIIKRLRDNSNDSHLARNPNHRKTTRPSISAAWRLLPTGFYLLLEVTINFQIGRFQNTGSGIPDSSTDWWKAFTAYHDMLHILLFYLDALNVTSVTFVGHAWAIFRSQRPTPGNLKFKQLRPVLDPALIVCAIGVPMTLCLYLSLSLGAASPISVYLSRSATVGPLVQHLWLTCNSSDILLVLWDILASVIFVMDPVWYLSYSATAKLLWGVPWGILGYTRLNGSDDFLWIPIRFAGYDVIHTILLIPMFMWMWWKLKRGWRGKEHEWKAARSWLCEKGGRARQYLRAKLTRR